ncbi:hypothetical protein CJJ23_04535 [Mycoplasmopsis agassizii]|uniref:PQ loop repeat n=1 Tax=Mycoplasmopsis agassizii TaxID=33922 RepID=A0A269TIH4_9BACT|nr:hypothetical protein [Mycoplasmopsis agassizii]PAK20980.1 hypothetical protein CJJ23_04535 [Mycoplasmopsis agassizii]
MNILEISNVIAWIASISVAITGLPQLVNVLRNKKAEKVNMYSWWLFATAIILFSTWGLMLDSGGQQLIIAELIAMIITAMTMFAFLHYRKDKVISFKAKLGQQIALSIYLIIIFAWTIWFFAVGQKPFADSEAKTAVSSVFANLGPIFSMVAFLPQTIMGIRKKTLYFIPLSFLINLIGFNVLWVLTFALRIQSVKIGLLPESLLVPYILGTLWQSINLAIALIQTTFYGIQIQKKKIIWI